MCICALPRKNKESFNIRPEQFIFHLPYDNGITGCARLSDYVMYKLFDIIDYQVALYACIKIPQDIVWSGSVLQ